MVPVVEIADGVPMPMIGFGLWQLTPDEAYASVRKALDVGYRHLDTATLYQNEAEVGAALRDSGVPREEVFLTTKLMPRDAGRVRETLERSLAALGVDRLDLWLIHWPSGGAMTETWRAFIAARDEGLTRAIGVSNYDPEALAELRDSTGELPGVNQIPWSPGGHDPALLAAHRELGVVVEGYSPLKNTDLSDPVLTRVAAAHGVTAAQVVLRWHLHHDIVVLPRSSKPERVAENFDLLSFELSAEEIAAIDALGR